MLSKCRHWNYFCVPVTPNVFDFQTIGRAFGGISWIRAPCCHRVSLTGGWLRAGHLHTAASQRAQHSPEGEVPSLSCPFDRRGN